jgi:hypothetical protein
MNKSCKPGHLKSFLIWGRGISNHFLFGANQPFITLMITHTFIEDAADNLVPRIVIKHNQDHIDIIVKAR